MKDKELERILKALANKRRLAIVRFIKKRKHAAVGDIADAIKLSFKATSRHLSRLLAADILDREQVKLFMFYRLAEKIPDPAAKIVQIL